MRSARVAIVVFLAALGARTAAAQQLPPPRCAAAAVCQPAGFMTLLNDAGESASFFGIRSRFGNGLEMGLLRPPGWPDPFSGGDPVEAAAEIFVRRHPLAQSAPPSAPGAPGAHTSPPSPPVTHPSPGSSKPA